jgi:L-2-hydroxyglutarate oxidase LhgO
METLEADTVVIGAGVVGLAAARALAMQGREVLILDKNSRIGEETSSRNSGVIHAGIVYAPGSRKARLCVDGKHRLYEFCARRGIPHSRIGKLIVATQAAEVAALDRAIGQAEAAGVTDLQRLDAGQVAQLEPDLRAVAGLLSPSTGIVDVHELMHSLLAEAEAHGAELALATPVAGGEVQPDGRIALHAGAPPVRLLARHVVNCAGLWSQKLAASIDGLPADSIPPQLLAKGSYFSLSGKGPFRRLIYPAPPGDGSLGVHLTLDMAGRTRFGPDIELRPDSVPETMDLDVDPRRGEVFYEAIRRYWPGLPDRALQPDYCGWRPKLAAGDAGQIDFRIDGADRHGLPGHVMCYGIESPGLTACLAIGDEIAALCRD